MPHLPLSFKYRQVTNKKPPLLQSKQGFLQSKKPHFFGRGFLKTMID
jgi:hypothetical protein